MIQKSADTFSYSLDMNGWLVNLKIFGVNFSPMNTQLWQHCDGNYKCIQVLTNATKNIGLLLFVDYYTNTIEFHAVCKLELTIENTQIFVLIT